MSSSAQVEDPGPLDERVLEYLHESNAIEDITNIRYSQTGPRDLGHPGAFVASQARATAREPVTVDDLGEWQRLITVEQVGYGHGMDARGIGVLRGPAAPFDVRVGSHLGTPYLDVPARVEAWLLELNAELGACGRSVDDATVVRLLGDTLQSFEAIHPFVDGNGRTGRLVANYVATFLNRALIVFRADERPAFYPAHRSRLAMRLFMGQKVREAVTGTSGQRFDRITGNDISGVYVGAGGKRLIVEWHELLRAEDRWRAELGPP